MEHIRSAGQRAAWHPRRAARTHSLALDSLGKALSPPENPDDFAVLDDGQQVDPLEQHHVCGLLQQHLIRPGVVSSTPFESPPRGGGRRHRTSGATVIGLLLMASPTVLLRILRTSSLHGERKKKRPFEQVARVDPAVQSQSGSTRVFTPLAGGPAARRAPGNASREGRERNGTEQTLAYRPGRPVAAPPCPRTGGRAEE